MSRFEVKNTKKLEELLIEVGEKYKLELINIAPNFLGGNNAYCGNELLRTIDKLGTPCITTEGEKLTNIVYVKFYLKLNTELGVVKTLLYSSHLSLADVEEYE